MIRAATGSVLSRLPLALIAALVGLVPAALIIADIFTGNLSAEPVEELMRRTGWWALTLLLITLSVTPIRRITGLNPLIKVRRPIGVLAFVYAACHFTIYLLIDQGLAWSFIIEDILERPLITAGFLALMMLLPLALTSTTGSIRRLGGRRWRRLHQLIYPAAMLGVLHYFWLIKADKTLPIVFAAILAGLLLFRLWKPIRDRMGSESSAASPSPTSPSRQVPVPELRRN